MRNAWNKVLWIFPYTIFISLVWLFVKYGKIDLSRFMLLENVTSKVIQQRHSFNQSINLSFLKYKKTKKHKMYQFRPIYQCVDTVTIHA